MNVTLKRIPVLVTGHNAVTATGTKEDSPVTEREITDLFNKGVKPVIEEMEEMFLKHKSQCDNEDPDHAEFLHSPDFIREKAAWFREVCERFSDIDSEFMDRFREKSMLYTTAFVATVLDRTTQRGSSMHIMGISNVEDIQMGMQLGMLLGEDKAQIDNLDKLFGDN